MSSRPWALGVSAENVPALRRADFLARLESEDALLEGRVLVSTCHRVELYGLGPAPQLEGEWTLREGRAAVSHLVRVAAGLESAVVGEDEVLHQVRQALEEARSRGPIAGGLQRLFEIAIAAGRRSRAGRADVGAGLAERAVEWLRSQSPSPAGPILVVGAGRMGAALSRVAGGAGRGLLVASRDRARAARLAALQGGEGLGLEEAAERARHCSGVAVALAGRWEVPAHALPLFPPLVDISAPSTLSPAGQGALRSYLGIDDLLLGAHRVPAAYMLEATRLAEAKTEEYWDWLLARSGHRQALLATEL